MTDYNQEITSANLSTAMQEPEVYAPIFQAAVNNSAFLQVATQLPPMSRNTRNVNILNVLPTAYWQSTGTTLKKTTAATWKGKTITAEEMAVIVPIAEDLLADTANTGYDLWKEITPLIGQAMGTLVDSACFMGTNLPSTWLTNTSGVSASILSAAGTASMTVTEGTGVDLYDDILGDAGTVSLVEQQGFMVNRHVGSISMRGKLRHVRDNRTATGAGLPILVREGQQQYTLDGDPCIFPLNNAITAASALLFSGDFSQFVYAIRQDITVKLITEGVIQDSEGAIVFNLPQQDMVALRFVFRIGAQVSNPVTQASATEATRYPVAVLTPSGT